MAYQRSYTVSTTKSPVGQINYGDNKIAGWVAFARIAAIVGEIAFTIAAPGVGAAIAAGVAGASAQTTIDYLAGEGNAVTTLINYASSVAPIAVLGTGSSAKVITYGVGEEKAAFVESKTFFKRFEAGSKEATTLSKKGVYATKPGTSGVGSLSEAELRALFGTREAKRAWLQGTRRGIKKGLLNAFSPSGKQLKTVKDVERTVNAFFKASNELGDSWERFILQLSSRQEQASATQNLFNFDIIDAWFDRVETIKAERLITVENRKEFDVLNQELIKRIRKKPMWDLETERQQLSNLLDPILGKAKARQAIYDAIKKDFATMFRNIKAVDSVSGLGGQIGKTALPENKVISRESIDALQKEGRLKAAKAAKDYGSWTAEEVAAELGSGSIKRTDKGIAKWENFHKEYQGKWKKTRVEASRNGSTMKDRALRRAARAAELDLLEDIRISQVNSDVMSFKHARRLRRKKPLHFFGTERGRFVTQAGQMSSGSDLGREIVNAPSKLILNGEFELAGKTWFRWEKTNPFLRAKQYMRETKVGKLGAKIYGTTEDIEMQARKHMIPFVYGSEWLLGVRVMKLDPAGHLNFMILFHKDRRYPPVFINKVPKKRMLEFITAPSPGAYYHSPRGWALSANGADIQAPAGLLALAGIAAPSLSALRNLLSLTSNTIGSAKNGFTSYWEEVSHAVQKNWHARSARAVGIIAGGRLGGKYATALERSIVQQTVDAQGRIKTRFNFKGKTLATAAATTVQTSVTSRQGTVGRRRRSSQRYMQNAIRRPVGQVQKLLR